MRSNRRRGRGHARYARPEHEQTTDIGDMLISEKIHDIPKREVTELVQQYEDQYIISNVPGQTDVRRCSLRCINDHPVNVKQYPLPFAVHESLKEEVAAVRALAVIE